MGYFGILPLNGLGLGPSPGSGRVWIKPGPDPDPLRVFFFFLKTYTRPYNLSSRVKSDPLGLDRAGYPWVGYKLPSLQKGKGIAAIVICADLGEDKKERPTLPATAITTL